MVITLRYASEGDIGGMVSIEANSFSEPWKSDEFEEFLRDRKTQAIVAEDAALLVGYCLWRRERSAYELVGIAVRPTSRRQGIATRLLETAKAELTKRRPVLYGLVSESNLEAQLFLRSQGFLATEVIRSPYGGYNQEDGYLMKYGVGAWTTGP